ncbi:MAG TPA: hypothetical protein VLD67_04780 [Vicinamibacterales bacterium]|nr:hypothetical protein [Vicinamibacterales bacterium]
MSLPPVFAASALYDSLLQAALRQFFSRATFDSEPTPSLSSDGRLAIEPTRDPSVLSVRWFGTRHVLHVPSRRPFTEHEARLARAIGAVLALRYRAIFDPKQMLERGDLFRGAIEDRYVGAFLELADHPGAPTARADLVSTAIEVLRVAALSSYENRPISSGVLLLDGEDDPEHGIAPAPAPVAYNYSQALTAFKSFYRLCDGLETLFLVNGSGVVLDIIEVERYARRARLDVPCPRLYRPHALATAGNRNISVVLSPSHEIKVFAGGVQAFSFRNARWHLLDVQAKYDMWAEAIGNAPLAERIFQMAIDLADARHGALFVVLRDPAGSLPQLVARSDRLDTARVDPGGLPTRSQFLHMLRGRTATGLDPAVLAGLARMDGATVVDQTGRLLAVGAILLHTEPPEPHSNLAVEGARTTAAMAAARFGAVLKVSEDGLITFYDRQEHLWDI